MFQNKIDEFRASLQASVRVSVVALAIASAAFVALCFLCAAGFLYLLDRYGAIDACLAFFCIFLIIVIALVIWYAVLKRRARKPKIAAKSAIQTAIADPMVIAAGLQIVRAIGVKRLIPIVAIGGALLGLLASSQRKNNPPL
jgi:predicted lipid-binding transport protein (Tim44 family)